MLDTIVRQNEEILLLLREVLAFVKPKAIVRKAAEPKKPKIITPVQQLVEAYKMAKDIDRGNKGWDKQNFARYAKSAAGLLDCFDGDVSNAGAYLFSQAEEFNSNGISWTLETIARHAWDNKGKIDEHKYSTLDAASLLEQSGSPASPQKGDVARRSSRPVRASEIPIAEFGVLDGSGDDSQP